MTEGREAPLPARHVCPLCTRDDLIDVVTLGPGLWRYTCSNSKRHRSGGPYTWEGTATSRVGEEASGKTEELGLYADLPLCLVSGEAYVEYGIVEYRYSRLRPPIFRQLLDDYGHTRLERGREDTV